MKRATKQNLRPDMIYKEAQHLVQYQGYSWERGRPSVKNNKKGVIKFLSTKYGVTARWIRACVKKAKAAEKMKTVVKPVSYSAGLAAAFAGNRALKPEVTKISNADNIKDNIQGIRGALMDMLKNSKGYSWRAIELAKALLEEIPKK